MVLLEVLMLLQLVFLCLRCSWCTTRFRQLVVGRDELFQRKHTGLIKSNSQPLVSGRCLSDDFIIWFSCWVRISIRTCFLNLQKLGRPARREVHGKLVAEHLSFWPTIWLNYARLEGWNSATFPGNLAASLHLWDWDSHFSLGLLNFGNRNRCQQDHWCTTLEIIAWVIFVPQVNVPSVVIVFGAVGFCWALAQ